MDFDMLRKRMVEQQLVPRQINDKRVIDAFLKVPRHKFVPSGEQEVAYGDFPLSVGYGQTISQPYMVALMTQCLKLKKSDKVLEIGTGSGYQAAILAELAKEVYSIERIKELADSAELILKELGYNNITIEVGDGTLGWSQKAPFDAIVVTAGAPKVPVALVDQLACGGRLVIPVGDTFSQMLTLLEKEKDKVTSQDICHCMFVPLVGKNGWKR